MKNNFVRKSIIYLILVILAVSSITPLLWTVSTSFKTRAATLSFPPKLFPDEISFNNYLDIFNNYSIGTFFINSILVTFISVFLQILICAMAAYAFARFSFRGKNILFMLYLMTMMIPFQVTSIPLYLIVRSFNWIDTYQGLILPRLFSAFGIVLMRQAFLSMPRDFEESAFLDGAGYLRMFFKIVIPMNKTAIATFAIFSFMDSWNSYLWPLIVTTSENMMTLPVGLAAFQGRWMTQWNLVSAGTIISILPIIIVFIFAQKWFMEGLASTGLKG